jgi:ubiquinone/menaquinone biosynthesis C-methylase UbiE
MVNTDSTEREMIDPRQMARETSLEHLSRTADNYFKSLADPTPWMTKPFTSLVEAPELLQNVGLLLSGLHLGKTMTVLDFGAGSCWLSRMLSQLQCQTIACDVSAAALEIGKDLFRRLPILGEGMFQPRFLPFDGKRIDLPDHAVDRIVCHDAFHHVPNQAQVLSEFARVLKPGGIAGFSEPGKHHSRSPQSQMEMKNYGVLENDIDPTDIFALAREAGFTRASCKLLNQMTLTLEEYDTLVNGPEEPSTGARALHAFEDRVFSNIRQTMTERTIFFLHKGELIPDSRSHSGLSHQLHLESEEFEIALGAPLSIKLTITNNGTAQWLADNVYGVGVVRLGSHLYDQEGNLIALDFSRHAFAHNVLPAQEVRMTALLQFPIRGTFKVALDLVSEGVSWFENFGSQPKYISVRVT